MKTTYSTNEEKVCCSCSHNIRCPYRGDLTNIQCFCELDNHYIGYVECMTMRCRHWTKEKEAKHDKRGKAKAD